MLKIMPIVYYLFAAALIGGGGMGSRVSGTWHSVGGGLAFGIVAIIAGVITRKNPPMGLIIGLVDALAVGAFFVYRYSSTGNPMPAFPSIAMALLVVGLTVAAKSQLTAGSQR